MNTKIILAQNISTNNLTYSENISLLNPFTKLHLPYIPSAASFSILIIYDNLFNENRLRVQIKIRENNINNLLLYDSGILNLDHLVKEKMIVNNYSFVYQFNNIPISSTGRHFIEVIINDHVFTETFTIVHKPNSYDS